MTKAVLICLLLALGHGNDAFQLKEDCKWNYTLKNAEQHNVFAVEMKDLGTAHSTDCQGLYDEAVPSYAMKTGRHVITVGLKRTKDLKLQDIKVSWRAEKGILRYLLVLELKEPHDGYTINEENTRCISVRMIPTQDAVQFQGSHDLAFDCIQVATGTMEAVLQTTVREHNNRRRKCKRKPCFEFSDPVHLATNINASCCRRRVYSNEVKLRAHDSCKWVISAKKESFSSWTYELRESNDTALLRDGKLLPINGLQNDTVVASVVNFDRPTIYILQVSFWCSFDPTEMAADLICAAITRQIDARLCGISNDQEHTEKIVADHPSSGSLLTLVVILASVALAMIGVAAVAYVTRKRPCCCCQKSYERHQNNFKTNGVNGALIKTDTTYTAEKICQPKKERPDTQELMEGLPT